MNKVILMGRLTRDPEVRYSQGERAMAIARYTLAVDRRGSRNNNGDGPTADFINCVAFDKRGEFAEKYFRRGMRVLVSGHIQTGSYIYRDLSALEKSIGGSDGENSSLDLFSLELFENIAFIMAKHADTSIPDTPEEWLDGFGTFSIYQVLPQLIELWGLNVKTDVEAKKTSRN